MTEKPENCPFCGEQMKLSPMIIYPNGEKSPAQLHCYNCNYTFTHGGFESNDEVVKNYNTRPLEDALRAKIEDLKREITRRGAFLEGLWHDRKVLRSQLADARAEVERLKEAARWIPVSEMKPPSATKFWGYFDWKEEGGRRFTVQGETELGSSFGGHDVWLCGIYEFDLQILRAWRLLPDPPEV